MAMRNAGAVVRRATALALALFVAPVVFAQPPIPVERVTFDEAVKRVIEKNPLVAIAAAGILRVEALLTQTRSAPFHARKRP